MDGIIALGAGKKYTDTQINLRITTGAVRLGNWNAETNTPTITQGVGNNNEYYEVSVAGTWDGTNFLIGDRIVFSSSKNKWERVATGKEDESATIVGYVDENTTSFPTTRPSGSPLKIGDNVKVLDTAILPFSIVNSEGVEVPFDSYYDEAEYNGTTFQEKSFVAGKTNEIGISDVDKEGIDGDEEYQSELNEKYSKTYKDYFQYTTFSDLDDLEEEKILKRVYHQTARTSERRAGYYIYDFTNHIWKGFGQVRFMKHLNAPMNLTADEVEEIFNNYNDGIITIVESVSGETLTPSAIYTTGNDCIVEFIVKEKIITYSLLLSTRVVTKKESEIQIDRGINIERLGAYTYKATFESLPPLDTTFDTYAKTGCTSFIRNKKMYRNLDFNYAKTIEWLVVTKDFDGCAFLLALQEDTKLDREKIWQLPYHINDGINRDGIMVSSHVLFNDFEFEGSGEKNEDITLFPYHILNELHNISDINTMMADYIANVKIPQSLIDRDFLMQFLVSDGTTSYVITPKVDGSGYEIVNATAFPKLANFNYVSRALVNRTDSDIQDRPTGIERWNEIESGVSLEDLRFTKCYEEPNRLSEFIGERDTDKHSTDEELMEIYEDAHEDYQTRTRDGSLWQTCHSVVYGEKGIEHLWTQENYKKDYIASSGGNEEETLIVDSAIMSAGSDKAEIDIPANSKVINFYAIYNNNITQMLNIEVALNKITFNAFSPVDENVNCFVVYETKQDKMITSKADISVGQTSTSISIPLTSEIISYFATQDGKSVPLEVSNNNNVITFSAGIPVEKKVECTLIYKVGV